MTCIKVLLVQPRLKSSAVRIVRIIMQTITRAATRGLVITFLWLGVARGLAVELHVATNGHDSWSGRAAAPNAAKTDGPFATLERARTELRQLKPAGKSGGESATVWVHDGLYELTKPFTLTAADSGIDRFPVVFRAVNTGKAVLIGGRQITGFTPHQGQVLKTDVNAQGFAGIYFRQLFFAGKRQHLARYPNFDAQNPYGGGWAYADGKLVPMYQDIPDEDRRTFTRNESDVRHWSRPTKSRYSFFRATTGGTTSSASSRSTPNRAA